MIVESAATYVAAVLEAFTYTSVATSAKSEAAARKAKATRSRKTVAFGSM